MPKILSDHMRKNKIKSKVGIEIEMVTVATDLKFTGQGIASNMTRILVETAAKKGYKIFFAECRSEFSKRAVEKQGGQVKKSIEYKDFQFKPGMCSQPTYPFAKAQEPHLVNSLVVINLDK